MFGGIWKVPLKIYLAAVTNDRDRNLVEAPYRARALNWVTSF